MNTAIHKYYLLIIPLILFPLLVFPKAALADGILINVSPSVLRIEAKHPADVWAPFSIENQSNQPISLKIGYRMFDKQASENGTVVFLKNSQSVALPDQHIFEKMQIVDDTNTSLDTIDLGQSQKERLRLHIIIPDSEPNGDYYFSVIFQQKGQQMNQNTTNNNSESQKSIATLIPGIGINVLLALGDTITPQGAIDDFSTSRFFESGPVVFNLAVHNYGIHFIQPQGVILIKNLFGQTIGKVYLPSSVILSGTSRTLSTNQNQPAISTKIAWPEHFLFGIYTATLYLSLSSNGPLFIRSIHFFAFPVQFIIGIAVIIVIFILLILKVIKKLR